MDAINDKKFLLLSAIAGFTGIAGLFLPFTMDVSPIMALLEKDFWELSAPCFLSVFISGATIRLIFSKSISTFERRVAYFISLFAAGLTLSNVYRFNETWPSGMQEWATKLVPLIVLMIGIFLLIIKRTSQKWSYQKPLVALQMVYIANCTLCLIGFLPNGGDFIPLGWQIGAYFCLIASVIYSIQIVLFLVLKEENSDQSEILISS